jgi:succinate dehydrogenase/fumarate reductase flavoprotein subunit
MNHQQQDISRRELLRMSALAGVGFAASGLSGCTPGGDGSGGGSVGTPAWDEEADFIVVGSGSGSIGALVAAEVGGAKVILLEKEAYVGGTTATSGFQCWMPGHHLQTPERLEKDKPELVLQYIRRADVYNKAPEDEVILDWLTNGPTVYEFMNKQMDLPMTNYVNNADYYDFPGWNIGRSLQLTMETEAYEGVPAYFADVLIPAMDKAGVDIRLSTEAIRLISDVEGAVTGVVAKSDNKEVQIKATNGVLLAAGPFDRNPDMVKAFLRGDLIGTNVALGCTGDGHRMGFEVGADFMGMSGVWGVPCYDTEGEGDIWDWSDWRAQANSIIVNRWGRRFMDEAGPYDSSNSSFWNMNTYFNGPSLNLPAFFIFDSTFVSYYKWPGGFDEQPKWVRSYDSLDALAQGEGIDQDGLFEQIQQFNSLAITGKDEQFNRGEKMWSSPVGLAGQFYGDVERPDLENRWLGPIETPPFHVAGMGAGSTSTSGGLRTDKHGQVLRNGQPIPGLYCTGCNAAPTTGSAYCGGGNANGPAFYHAVAAANHALNLGIY